MEWNSNSFEGYCRSCDSEKPSKQQLIISLGEVVEIASVDIGDKGTSGKNHELIICRKLLVILSSTTQLLRMVISVVDSRKHVS